MTKYIRIRNLSDEEFFVPRIALEKLGLSTKRDDADTIGRFGSGIKFAPIAALRNGWDWWFVGNDTNGSYYMQYVVRQEDGIDCVWYDYGTDLKPSSFTLGAGELSWTDPFQIIREPIANAMDGVKTYGGDWSLDIVDEVGESSPYTFDVYITASPELMNIVDNIDAYFSFNKKKIFSYGRSHILNSYGSDLRVFSQSVLVAHNELPSLYDYEFDSIDLNEERTVKSEWDLGWKIAYLVSNVTSEKMIEKIIKSALTESKFEWSSTTAHHYENIDGAGDWDSAFKGMFGDNAVIYPASNMSSSIEQTLRLRGIKGIAVYTDEAYKMLSGLGISTFMTIVGEDFEYEIDSDISKYPVLIDALDIVKSFEPDIAKYLGDCGVLLGEASNNCKGLTLNKDNPALCRILVSKDHLQTGSLSDIVATLIHEYDHASTGIGDGYSDEGKKFRDLADKRIGKMIVDNYKPNPFFIEDGVVCCRVSDLSKVGNNLIAVTEHIGMLDCYFMKIGDFVLKATGDRIEENFGHEHNPHFAQGASTVTYPTFINVKEIEVVN